MADSDVEEITIVLKDGTTTARWTGDDAEMILSRIIAAHYYGASTEENLRRCNPPPKITKPLRKVTEDWNCAFGHSCHYIYDTQTSSNAAWKMDDICPPEALSRPGRPPKLFRFRITVEAVPVEEKDR